jgi:hypothetical protein
MSLTLSFYLVAIPAVVLLGLAKGGLYGIGTIATPMLALVIPPMTAAAIVVPILIIQDVVSVWAFRRTFDKHVLAVMIPSSFVGVFLGWAFAARVAPNVVLACLGAMSILFAAYRLWGDYGHRVRIALSATARDELQEGSLPPQMVSAQILPDWIGWLCGIGAGFTSQVAHAGGPPFQMWVLPRRLPRDSLVGTSAITFAVINWAKLPTYAALGQFTQDNLIASATLVPLAILTTFAGVKLVRIIPTEPFYLVMYILMIVIGGKLLWDGLL